MVKLSVFRWTGLAFYCVSYFLPAIGNPDHRMEHSVPGWGCAWLSLWFGVGGIFVRSGITPEGRRFFLSLLWPGLANPLLLLYFVLALRRRGVLFRRMVAVLVLVFATSAAVVIPHTPFVPLVGCYLWVAGLILMLGPDILLAIRQMKVRFARSAAQIQGCLPRRATRL